MDTNLRLEKLLNEKGWTKYKLAKESGLSESTIINMFARNTVPSIASLEAICNAFKITMSQFFADDEMIELSPELKELFQQWSYLSDEQKEAVMKIIKTMNMNQK